MEFARAKQTELGEIKALADVSLRGKLSLSYFEKRLRDFFYVAKEEGKIVGFILVEGLTLSLLVVEKAKRHQGIASAMVGFALKESPELFLKVRESNAEAQKYYRDNGWKYWGKANGAFKNREAGLIYSKRA